MLVEIVIFYFFVVNRKIKCQTTRTVHIFCTAEIIFIEESTGIMIYGKNIKNQTLFENLKRYWKNYHHENKRYFWWLGILMPRLERSIRIKWHKSCQTLPDIEFFLELIRNKYEQFNLCDFHDNAEDYFETLQRWKLESERCRNFKTKRHMKILEASKKALIRG